MQYRNHKHRNPSSNKSASVWQRSIKELSPEDAAYLGGVVFFLQTYLGKELIQEEADIWTLKLSEYPRWKLARLDEYPAESGSALGKVCAWLDDLMPEPRPAREAMSGAKQLEHSPRREIATDVIKHYCTLLDTDEKRADEFERRGIEDLRAKYPGVNFQCGRKANL